MSVPIVQRSPSTETRTVLYIGEDVSITCTTKVTGIHVVFTWRAENSLTQRPVIVSNKTTHLTPVSSVFKPTVVANTHANIFCSVMIADNANIAASEEAVSFFQLISKIQHSTIITKNEHDNN